MDAENQEKSTELPINDGTTPLRDEKGRIIEGSPPINTEGNNGHLAGWQRYGTRLQRYGKMSYEELKALTNDEVHMGKLSAFDRAAAFQALKIADHKDTDHIPERERGNDRIEGKARQPLAVGGDPDNNTPIQWDGTFTLKFPDANAKSPDQT